MDHSLEQRYAEKFCVKLNKSVTDTLSILREAYGEEVVSRTQVYTLHKGAVREADPIDNGYECGSH